MEIKRKAISVMIAFCMIFTIMLLTSGTAFADETTLQTVPADAGLSYIGGGTDTERVLPQDVNGTKYLMLPASAEYANLPLTLNEGVHLTGTVEGITITSTEAGAGPVNLVLLFGLMEPGKPYEVKAWYGETLLESIFVMKSRDIPSMHIVLKKGTLQKIHKNKSNKGSGQMFFRDGDDVIDVALTQIKGRGNTSWKYSGEKKPYNIKLDSKEELIPGAGGAKSWCLLSNNCYDKTGLSNYLAYNLYENIGGASPMKSQTIDLYINHEYRGTYFLTEKVEIKETRIDVKETEYAVEDEDYSTLVTAGEIEDLKQVDFRKSISTEGKKLTWVKAPAYDKALRSGIQAYQYATYAEVETPGGFLLEIDSTFYKEASWFITRRGTTIVVKDPEYASKEQVQQIAIFVQEFEDALFSDSGCNARGKSYEDYIDMDSFVKRIAVDAVMNNQDVMDKSSYFYIDVDDSGGFQNQKLFAGPAWDYDLCSPAENLLVYFKQYLDKESDHEGRQTWAVALLKRGTLMEQLKAFSDGTLKTAWNELAAQLPEVIGDLAVSQKLNALLWGNDFAGGASQLQDSFANTRYQFWYNEAFNPAEKLLGVSVSYDSSSSLATAKVSGSADSYQWYKVNVDGTKEDIAGATETSYEIPKGEPGRYGVAVTGGNPGAGSYEDSETITMYSNVIEIGLKVSFVGDGRYADGGQILIKSGASIPAEQWPAVPDRNGYSGVWSQADLSNVKESKTVEAVYTPYTYTVVYDGNGADGGATAASEHTYDAAAPLSVNGFYKTHYRQTSWNTKADGTGRSYGDGETVKNLTDVQNGQVTLYAQWELAPYQLTYENVEGAENKNPSTYTIEDQITLSDLTRDGYDFAGWTWDGQGEPTKSATVDTAAGGDKVFTAVWKKHGTNCIVNVDKTDLVYDGKEKNPLVTVTDGEEIVDPSNYVVIYGEGRTEPGEYTVTVQLQGDYADMERDGTFTIIEPPAAPKSVKVNLHTADGGYDDISVSWKASEGAAKYRVYYKAATGKFKLMTTTAKTSAVKKNLKDGTKYSVKVVPCFVYEGKTYEGTPSKTASVVTLKKVQLTKAEVKNGKVRLTWKNIAGETGYQISKAVKKKETDTLRTFRGAKTKQKLVRAKKGEVYYYKIRAYKTVGLKKVFGPWSNVKQCKIEKPVKKVTKKTVKKTEKKKK